MDFFDAVGDKDIDHMSKILLAKPLAPFLRGRNKQHVSVFRAVWTFPATGGEAWLTSCFVFEWAPNHRVVVFSPKIKPVLCECERSVEP